MKLAVIGATGLVGNEIIKVLEENKLNISDLYLVASKKSCGKIITFNNKTYNCITIEDLLNKDIDIAILSAGSKISEIYAPILAKKGTFVIDNSSQWRMHESVPLVVPEVNSNTISENTKIIANPNCSTIQMVLALSRLHWEYKLKQIVVATYQSVTGSGMKGVLQLESERKGEISERIYPHQIDLNCLPHAGDFLDNNYTTEEIKLINETHKIFNDHNIKISPTAVRVPVIGGHSEAIHAVFEKEIDISKVIKLLNDTPGVTVIDNPNLCEYPMPINVKGKNEVFIGRIRLDLFDKKAINMWVVADNLRKGASTNAVQIAEYIINNIIRKNNL
ncbi:MAG: aspartate-semialdehyde dehydrogenase [Bacteroidales bacterium]|jgi:aspartate-semialdehyde dehydrogenase|nr:aspartate-semialdehyde dehydrogenase [Bacteroidales bacterium]MDI9576274.1 aspartate-semialdehyde dehydrogenase [Bacteroidota bacterium]MDD3756251.1 aspartate-semialdehyde dehydrogenase [Bacteroidales bacterium]MDY0400605.1 aspartate-semialdehyde dehydrogenase [Bacteroidales bacterium]HHW59536.1 aspartate-semialdehyde dehydrogenase [Bacteroidales bacterium]